VYLKLKSDAFSPILFAKNMSKTINIDIAIDEMILFLKIRDSETH
jgi:hypothetical protein